jgi:trimethylamine--corrinoid protein Co-methyltransferase
VGYLETGLCGSLEYLIMLDEMIGITRRILQPFRVDAETLALDLIDAVGPAGHFLDADHTRQHFREEVWYPSLFDRQNYDGWRAAGATTLRERARARVKELLATHKPSPLPPEVEAVVAEYEEIRKWGN